MPSLVEPVAVAGRTAPSRVVFGPHETNLGPGSRHSATATSPTTRPGRPAVPASSSPRPPRSTRRTGPTSGPRWPRRAGPGWAAVAEACHPHGTLVLAGLGHCGGQGSSAYSQSVMWAPSPVADVVSREMPVEMEPVGHRRAGRRLRRAPPGGPMASGSTAWRSTPAPARCSASSTPGSPTCAPTATDRTACR